MLSYFSGLRDGARTGARGRMRWCSLALGAGEIKGEQEPARGKQELSKQRELQTRAGYLQSEGGAGGEVRGGKLGRLAKRCALLPSAPARFGSRIHICRAHRQLCYSPAHSHEATHISLSYIYSCSSELARMKRGRIFAGKKKNLPVVVPAPGAALPGTVSYPHPAGGRLLEPWGASIRGQGGQPVPPSPHETPQLAWTEEPGVFLFSPLSPSGCFLSRGAPRSPCPAPLLLPLPLLSVLCPRERPSHELWCAGSSATSSALPPPAPSPPALLLSPCASAAPRLSPPQISAPPLTFPRPPRSVLLLPFPGCLSPSLIAMQAVAKKSVTPW